MNGRSTMKLGKHKFSIIILLIICFLSACGKNTGKAAIIGTWNSTEGHSKLIFNENGTWSFDASCPANGTWVLTEGKTNEIQMPSQSGLGQDMWHVGGVHEYSIEGKILKLDGVGEFEKE